MASNTDIRGVWTYRSFRNLPGTTDSFDKLKVWEAELYLELEEGVRLHGHLGERPARASGKDPYLHVRGEVVPGQPTTVRWRATGVPKSAFDGWIYDYVGYLAPTWIDSKTQRPAIVGTVTRTVPHNGAPAGAVFSFLAVKSDFVEARRVIPLAKPVIDMMASAEHRYHHALWHGSRDEWGTLSNEKKQALRAKGWQPGPAHTERPSFGSDRANGHTNGSGEDFLFMHRRMIQHVRQLDPKVGTWRQLPQPGPLASFAEGFEAAKIGNPNGFALPPAWTIPDDTSTTSWLTELRKQSTLFAKFQAWEQLYTDPRYLATLSLGELGSRIEWTIHNWMHMRWMSVTRDPDPDPAKRGLPIPDGRRPLDFDKKWLDPEYDFLGETFSSHVHPVFWRLHGWVDDRIEDWFRAQQATRPGVVQRKQLSGVNWFEVDGQWVKHADPWEGPRQPHNGGHHHHGGGHGDIALDVQTMREALEIIYGPEPTARPAALAEARLAEESPARATWFKLMEDV